MSVVGASLLRPSATSLICDGSPNSLLRERVKTDQLLPRQHKRATNSQVKDASSADVSDLGAGVADLRLLKATLSRVPPEDGNCEDDQRSSVSHPARERGQGGEGGSYYYAHGRVQILQALPRGCLDILTNAARKGMGGQLTQAALLRDAEEKQDVRLGPRHVSQRMGKSDASCPETLRSCLPAAWAGIV